MTSKRDQVTIDKFAERDVDLSMARNNLWHFCNILMPNFYRPERSYLTEMCDQIENFIRQSDKHFLVINAPPRHGKSLTAQLLTAWLFGRELKENKRYTKVMTASYNEKLSTTFARSVRNLIQTEKVGDRIIYSDIFPKTKVKYGEASAQMWALDGSGEVNYLATAPNATSTGFGSHYLIIDDLIKSAEDAYNENVLDEHWIWFNNTFLSRTEGDNWKVILIMTRWAEADLAGRVIEAFPQDIELLTFKAVQDDGAMLCSDILNRADYDLKTKEMNIDIVEANYNQKPIDIQGRLYNDLKVWKERPEFTQIANFTDTADTGNDYLCSINYGIYEDEAYVLDVVFSDAAMEVTEPAVANLLNDGEIQTAIIESNNGGRGFARNVEAILKNIGDRRCMIQSVVQTKNKESRILASSAWVQNHVYMPFGWRERWPEFYKQVMSYQRKGKNVHDDAVDVLASIYERVCTGTTLDIVTESDLGFGRTRPSRSYWN